MRKISTLNKFAAVLLVPAFLVASSCTPTQVNTANDVLNGISTAISFAKPLIEAAETQFPDKPKVVAALVATRASLSTLESAVAAISAGVEKDWSKLAAAATDLFFKALTLRAAIEEAIKASKAAKAAK
jgi:hypothetical protein